MRTYGKRPLLEEKIKKLSGLKTIVTRIKTAGKTVVFTNGCFDLIHYGHVKYLEDAGCLGDILVVAVNSDDSIRRIKGKNRPIVNQADRIRVIAGLASVDYAVIFNEDTPLSAIKAIKPDVLVKGSDWDRKNIVGANFVLGYGGKVCTIELAPGRSTTKLITKIAKIF